MSGENALETLFETLNFEQLHRPRSYSELVGGMDTIDKLLQSDAACREEYRLGSGPFKVYREEVFPFRVLADQYFCDKAAKFEFPADDGRRDVLVNWPESNNEASNPVEIVNAVDGHDERLRMELLTRERRTPGAGPIRKIKSKGRAYRIEAETIAQTQSSIIAKTCKLVADAIEIKADKGLSHYPPETWLLVSFDDHVGFESEHDYGYITRTAANFARSTNFERVYVVGELHRGFCQQVL